MGTAESTLGSGSALPQAPGCSTSWLRTMQTTRNSQMVWTGTSFHRTTQTDTGSQGMTTECGERRRPSTMATPARELTLTGTGISTGLRLEPLGTAAARLIMVLSLSLRSKLARTGSSSTKPSTATASSSLYHGATLRLLLLATMLFMQSTENTMRLAASHVSSTLQRAPPSTGLLVLPTSHMCTALS